jgi:hypothetical protein
MDRVYDGGGLLGRLDGRSWCRWRPTWEELLALEPALAVAESPVVLAGRPLRAAEWRFVEGVVGDHVGLFGVNAAHPLLGEAAAYEAVMDYLRGLSKSMGQPPRWRGRRWRW